MTPALWVSQSLVPPVSLCAGAQETGGHFMKGLFQTAARAWLFFTALSQIRSLAALPFRRHRGSATSVRFPESSVSLPRRALQRDQNLTSVPRTQGLLWSWAMRALLKGLGQKGPFSSSSAIIALIQAELFGLLALTLPPLYAPSLLTVAAVLPVLFFPFFMQQLKKKKSSIVLLAHIAYAFGFPPFEHRKSLPFFPHKPLFIYLLMCTFIHPSIQLLICLFAFSLFAVAILQSFTNSEVRREI